jgi:FtsP/CotA-like multicopper oxidase with cupredoxin domain
LAREALARGSVTIPSSSGWWSASRVSRRISGSSLLILTDNRFRRGGAIDIDPGQGPPNPIDEANGREGDVLFVNGQIRPILAILARGVQRWRIINASAARYYRLFLPGHPFLQVGTDGGLFEHPVVRSEILLTVSEQVELLVQGSGAPGSRSVLQSLPYDRYVPQTRPKDWDHPRGPAHPGVSPGHALEPAGDPG